MTLSIAALLKKQSPSRHFGHGWIELPDGRRWNPGREKLAYANPRRLLTRWIKRVGATR